MSLNLDLVSIYKHMMAPVAKTSPFCPVHTSLPFNARSDCFPKDVSVEISNINDCELNHKAHLSIFTKPQGQVIQEGY